VERGLRDGRGSVLHRGVPARSDAWPRTVSLEVLGTDLLERNLAAARVGEYGHGRGALRPVLHPIFKDTGNARVRIDDAGARGHPFGEHNLLEEPPGQFDLIFCRNVLVYFSQHAVRTVVAPPLASAPPRRSAPVRLDGRLRAAAGPLRASPPELQVYRRLDARPAAKASRSGRRAFARAGAALRPSRAPGRTGRAALAGPDAHRAGREEAGRKELTDLARQVPDYVPGILERALLHVRMGEKSAASKLMREVLKRIEKLPGDEVLAGPEPLPVSFYRDSAQTFLSSSRGGFE